MFSFLSGTHQSRLLDLIVNSLIYFELISVYGINSFTCRYSVVPVPFVEGTVVFLLNHLGTLVKCQLIVNVMIHFWTFNYISLIYLNILMPLSHFLNYCNFVAMMKSGLFCTPTLFLFFKIVLAIPDPLSFLHMNFRNNLSMYAARILIGIMLNL